MAENTIKEAMEEVAGYIGEKVSGKEDVFRYSTIPTASAEYVDKIVEYTGTTNANYTNGYFYKCVAQGTDPETYAWEQKNVQPTSTGDSRIQSEITEIGATRTGTTFRPYIIVSFDIPPIDELTWEDVIEFADEYYNGNISLAEIQASWQPGQTIDLPLSAMAASSGLSDTHVAQTVSVELIGINHNSMVSEEETKPKALCSFLMKDALLESGVMATSGTPVWGNTPRRAWGNSTFLEAMPQLLQDNVKEVYRPSRYGRAVGDYTTVEDKIWIPTSPELFNKSVPEHSIYESYFSYFDVNSKRIRYQNETAALWMCSNLEYLGTAYVAMPGVKADGTKQTDGGMTSAHALVMGFCI